MRNSFLFLCVAVLSAAIPAHAAVNVVQHHNSDARDGLYVDAAFTHGAAAGLRRVMAFNGTISGNVYAQPLYVTNRTTRKGMIIVATQSNNVYALDANTGAVIWQRNVGTPIVSGLPCGNISPVGI